MTQHNDLTGALAHGIDRRLVIDTVPYALRTRTTEQLGGNHTDTRKYDDGPDALPLGVARVHQPGAKGVRLTDVDTTAFMQARELYLTRTHPERYDDWHVEMASDLARQAALRDGTLVADCHRCHTTSQVAPDAARCNFCGGMYA